VSVDVVLTVEERRAALLDDARAGLTGEPKSLPPVWLYDEAGSRLFDQITRLPEYYPARTEASILRTRAADIAAAAGADTLVELGSGTSEKTRLLLDAMSAADELGRIVLFDVSVDVLEPAATALADEYDVDVHGIVGDFERHLARVPGGVRRLWALLGSTIGNLTGGARSRLLASLRTSLRPDEQLLLGTDLVKAVDRLVAAYDDATGVTAAFDRNVLAVLNRELGADFDLETFDHLARWDPQREWIEMRLRSRLDQHVEVRDLDLTVFFGAGEELRTEICDKFRPPSLAAELTSAGFVVDQTYSDEQGDFQLTLAHPASAPG
jgi:L-histidine N-alpha-methyltransferase